MRFTLSWLEEHLEWQGEPRSGREAARPEPAAVAEAIDALGLEVKSLTRPRPHLRASRSPASWRPPPTRTPTACACARWRSPPEANPPRRPRRAVRPVRAARPSARSSKSSAERPTPRPGWSGSSPLRGAASIPGTGVQLERAVIRGVESCGMLLSERELGLSDDHEGIRRPESRRPPPSPSARAVPASGGAR